MVAKALMIAIEALKLIEEISSDRHVSYIVMEALTKIERLYK